MWSTSYPASARSRPSRRLAREHRHALPCGARSSFRPGGGGQDDHWRADPDDGAGDLDPTGGFLCLDRDVYPFARDHLHLRRRGVLAVAPARKPRFAARSPRALAGLVLCGLFVTGGAWINKAARDLHGHRRFDQQHRWRRVLPLRCVQPMRSPVLRSVLCTPQDRVNLNRGKQRRRLGPPAGFARSA